MGRSYLYYSLMDEILVEHGLPTELKHLTVIESALDPHAVSPHGAMGMWQFMPGTAKYIGLKVNHFYDERKDVFKSTHAAARYLKYLHGKYDDWLLAIAAYNGGPGTVNKAIRRSGGKNTFWEVRPYLPRETRNYVPAFIAVNYFMSYAYEHNLDPEYPESYKKPVNSSTIDTVVITQQVSFEVISEYLGMTMEEIEYLNPGFNKNYIPFLFGPYEFNIPCDKKEVFNSLRDSLYFAEQLRLSSSEKYTYTVKLGDNLFLIAKHFGCNIWDLKEWNYLQCNMIYEHQKLLIYMPTRSSSLPVKIETTEKLNTDESLGTSRLNNTIHRKNYVFYKISPGDKIKDIALQYLDLSVHHLKEYNNIVIRGSLMPGSLMQFKNSG